MSNRSCDAPAEQGRAETFDRGFSHAPHRERVSRVREMPGPHGNHDRGPMRRQDYAKSMMRWSLSYPHVQGLGTGWYRYSRHPQRCVVSAESPTRPGNRIQWDGMRLFEAWGPHSIPAASTFNNNFVILLHERPPKSQ